VYILAIALIDICR